MKKAVSALVLSEGGLFSRQRKRCQRRQSESGAMRELMAAGFEVLWLCPGTDKCNWCNTLMEMYEIEVVDAFGVHAGKIMEGLESLWLKPYKDEASGVEMTFEEWSEYIKCLTQ